jgi:patatin-like phospholipase/acyl hydrolase
MGVLPGLRILSLDGGGTKGYFSLFILLKYYKFLAQQKIHFKDVFNLVVGSSVGSFIGALFVYGLVNIDHDWITAVGTILKDIFTVKNRDGPLFDTIYDGTGKRKVLSNIFKDIKFGDALVPFVVSTVSLDDGEMIFKSWDKDHSCLNLVDILDASSAAPVYFPPVEIGKQLLFDGGIIFNNPLDLATLITLELFGGYKARKSCKILSIGANYKDDKNELGGRKKELGTRKENYGLLSLMRQNFLNVLLRTNIRFPLSISKVVFGPESVIRLSIDVNVKLDSIDEDDISLIIKLADSVWQEHHDKVCTFLNDHV